MESGKDFKTNLTLGNGSSQKQMVMGCTHGGMEIDTRESGSSA